MLVTTHQTAATLEKVPTLARPRAAPAIELAEAGVQAEEETKGLGALGGAGVGEEIGVIVGAGVEEIGVPVGAKERIGALVGAEGVPVEEEVAVVVRRREREEEMTEVTTEVVGVVAKVQEGTDTEETVVVLVPQDMKRKS